MADFNEMLFGTMAKEIAEHIMFGGEAFDAAFDVESEFGDGPDYRYRVLGTSDYSTYEEEETGIIVTGQAECSIDELKVQRYDEETEAWVDVPADINLRDLARAVVYELE